MQSILDMQSFGTSEAVVATQDFVFFDLGKKRFVVKSAKSNVGSRIVKERGGVKLIN